VAEHVSAVGCAAALRHLLCSGEESPNGVFLLRFLLQVAFSISVNCMRSLPFYFTDLKRRKRDVAMAFTAMVLVHRARVGCKHSQTDTAS
jgi:hypothetical protein